VEGRLLGRERSAEVLELERGRVGSKRAGRTAVKLKRWRGEEGTMTDLEVSMIMNIKHFIEVEVVLLEGL
jgi:hypothetical protein